MSNYSRKLQEIDMLKFCKDTIVTIAANAYYQGYINTSENLTWENAYKRVANCVDDYLSDLQSESVEKN